jgi:hypothetical protein
MKRGYLIVCVLATSRCLPLQVQQTAIAYQVRQDAARLAPRPPAPVGGRVEPGRLAVSGGIHWSHLPDAVSGAASSTATAPSLYGQRTPALSGAASLAYGINASANVAADCVFGDAATSVRVHPALSEAAMFSGVLWRCGAGARMFYPPTGALKVMAGLSAVFNNALAQREVTETIERTTTTYGRDGRLESRVGTRATTVFDERKTLGLFSMLLMFGGVYEPRAWLSFELASAVGFEPAFARSTDRSVRVAGLIDGQGIGLSALENERMTPVVMGWFGAAIGPPIARLALRVHGNVGDFGGRGGALIGAEAAMVFGLPVNLPRAPRAR